MTTEVEQLASSIAEKYHETGSSQHYFTIKLIKVLVQIFAHQKMENMSMHDYSQFLYEQPLDHLPVYWNQSVRSRTSP